MEKEIRDLIKAGENSRVEFKRTITSVHKIAKTITSLANSHGGILLIGVSDQGLILGIEEEEERFMIDQAAQFHIKPVLDLQITAYSNDYDRTILKVLIPDSANKPHACQQPDGSWLFYIRNGDQSVQASDAVLKVLKSANPESDQITKPKGTRNQQTLEHYLRKHKRITLAEFAKLINVSKRRASRVLFDLVQGGVLYEHTYEKTIFYTLTD